MEQGRTQGPSGSKFPLLSTTSHVPWMKANRCILDTVYKIRNTEVISYNP